MIITAQKQHTVLGGHTNPTGLHAELSALLGTALLGISHDGHAELKVNVSGSTTTEQQDSARAIISAHNPVLMNAGRVGDTITAVAWMPYSGVTAAFFTLDGQALPTATTFGPHIQSGYTGLEVIVQAERVTIGVSGYPTKEAIL